MAGAGGISITVLILAFVAACVFQSNGLEAENEASYMTIKDVQSLCRNLGKCGNVLCCEGKTVRVKGYLDPANIWDKEKYLWLDYEKFIITGAPDPRHDTSDSMEIYVVGNDTASFFQKLRQISSRKLICVEGAIEGINAYTNKGVFRLFRIKAYPENIIFVDS